MDLRDNTHDQVEQHINTLRVIAAQETPPLLLWQEIQRILIHSADHLESHILPTIESKAPILDLRTGTVGSLNKIAEYVGATSGEGEGLALLPERPSGFLRGSGPRTSALMNGDAPGPVEEAKA